MRTNNLYIGLIFIFVTTSLIDLSAQRKNYIDESTFKNFMANRLDPLVVGYQYSVGDEAGILFSDYGGNAVQELGILTVPWNSAWRQMSASVAKMICTVATMHILENTSIAGAPNLNDKLNLKLKDFLPLRWRSLIDGTEGDVTLRMLMQHRSGFSGNDIESNPKTVLQQTMNTPVPDAFEYQNINFNFVGFMAMYIGHQSEMAQNETNWGDFSDFNYDLLFHADIRTRYRNYVQAHIFNPIGITPPCAATLDSDETEVLRYRDKSDLTGMDLGTVRTCMSNGWMLSAIEMVRFMQKWDNPQLAGNILSQESVDLINNFGSIPIGWTANRDAYDGQIFGLGHNGIWRYDGHQFTSEIVLIDDHTYMAINVNSGATDANVTDRGKDLIDAYDAAYCVNSLLVSNSNIENQMSAANQITTVGSTIVNPGETSIFKAPSIISLTPGFRAVQGSTFRAYRAGCSTYPSIE